MASKGICKPSFPLAPVIGKTRGSTGGPEDSGQKWAAFCINYTEEVSTLAHCRLSEGTAHTYIQKKKKNGGGKEKIRGDNEYRQYFRLLTFLKRLKTGRMGNTGILHCSNMQRNIREGTIWTCSSGV